MPDHKKKGSKSAPRSRAQDTISPYYASQKYGSPIEKATAKASMRDYFSGKSKANKSGETEAQHMSRMAKRDTIPAARTSRGVYSAGAMGNNMSKAIKATPGRRKK